MHLLFKVSLDNANRPPCIKNIIPDTHATIAQVFVYPSFSSKAGVYMLCGCISGVILMDIIKSSEKIKHIREQSIWVFVHQ